MNILLLTAESVYKNITEETKKIQVQGLQQTQQMW